MADKLNIAASNKLCCWKSPRKDGFILISENEEDLIQVPVARFYISTV
jgi:uncharacterized protein YcgL (UPF0745 family)